MNEKEKEAVKEFKKQLRLAMNIDDIATTIRNGYAQIILNLLEKLQKENEELRFEERRRTIGEYGAVEIHDVINRTLSNDYIPVQKVKDKIEYLDNQQKQWLEDRKLKASDSEIIFSRDILQKLLESEE